MRALFRKKTIENTIAVAREHSLKKTLGLLDIVLLGIGVVIGTGIFVLTGVAAAKYAGPAISISYFLAGIISIFAALAYAELASMVPVAGSSYTYSYVIMGEFVAWLVAWCLVLGYTVCAATVAAGWSGYFTGILTAAGYHLPKYLVTVPSEGGLVNLPAVFITFFVGILLFRGTKESAIVNRFLVATKLFVIFLFLIIAVPHIKTVNYADFMPFGLHGITAGAAVIFFAYTGFDAIISGAEEAKNPKRDIPIGIILSLLICSAIYVAVALTLTGITHYSELNNSEPVAFALRANGSNIGSVLVGIGAIVGMLAVMLVLMYGQSRVLFVMSRDGLLPNVFEKLHKKFATPYVSCNVVTVAVMLISGFTPIATMGSLTSLGVLIVFMIVACGVLMLRIQRPKLERPFRCPGVFVVAPMAILGCGYLAYTLLLEVGKPFFIWMACGVVAYFLYAYHKSPLNPKNSKN